MRISNQSLTWSAGALLGLAGSIGLSGCAGPPAAPPEVRIPAPSASSAAPPATAPPEHAPTAGMVRLPGGTFKMGETQNTVTVASFWLDVTEVTAAAYETCGRAHQCSIDKLSCDDGSNYGVRGKGNHPINCVSWSDADTYCKTKGKRLPTEQEWEWAARGTSRGTAYPWGNDEPTSQICWKRHDDATNTDEGTCAVGSFPHGNSPEGLQDLGGNVSEWTSSAAGTAAEPTHVFRGSSWLQNESYHSLATRGQDARLIYRSVVLGFRCALDGG